MGGTPPLLGTHPNQRSKAGFVKLMAAAPQPGTGNEGNQKQKGRGRNREKQQRKSDTKVQRVSKRERLGFHAKRLNTITCGHGPQMSPCLKIRQNLVGGISKTPRRMPHWGVHTLTFAWCSFSFRQSDEKHIHRWWLSLAHHCVGLMVLKQTFLFVSHMAQALLLFPQCTEGPLR